jgi:glyceraldehyde-3-phosphate dehydrogenase (NAD(P))
LYQTLGYDFDLFSSALKLNTQYMHTIFFDLKVKNPTSVEKLRAHLEANDRVAVTYKDSANAVFSFGRDQGHYGRILNVTVVVLPSLTVRNEREIVGYCFTPQDGNSLLSSVSAACWLLDPDGYEDRIQCLRPFYHDEV